MGSVEGRGVVGVGLVLGLLRWGAEEKEGESGLVVRPAGGREGEVC